jgi:UDP-3-O-[3-hydroxymyristoyl] N-acetylglucosamine deacetylase
LLLSTGGRIQQEQGMNVLQGTVNSPVTIAGIGLHSGRRVRVDILPAAVDTGISFLRTDRSDSREVVATVANISTTNLSTTLGFGSSAVATVEHLLAALFGLGVDNARILVDSCELPILDGSAAPFVAAITQVGVRRQSAGRRFLVINDTFRVSDGDKFIEIAPGAGSRFTCEIAYPSRAIGVQSFSLNIAQADFAELCGARTFCHFDEIESMRRNGLALGGSLENAVFVNNECVLNEEGLRHDDEFVRHKLLDCIGDFSLLGGVLIGNVRMNKPGHTLNAMFMRALSQECRRLISEVRLPDLRSGETEKMLELRVASAM